MGLRSCGRSTSPGPLRPSRHPLVTTGPKPFVVLTAKALHLEHHHVCVTVVLVGGRVLLARLGAGSRIVSTSYDRCRGDWYGDAGTASDDVNDTMTEPDQTDWALREAIYAGLAATGVAPARDALARVAGGHRELEQRLRMLHEHHLVVLDRDGSIRMALPFSAIPTDHVVRSGDRLWFANCAWDALAIPAALNIDADIEAPWLDDDTPVALRIVDGELVGQLDAYVHFVVPARRWWDDIVDT